MSFHCIALAVSKFKIEFLNIFFSLSPSQHFEKKNIFGNFSTFYFQLLKTKIVIYSVNLNSCPLDTNFQFDEENNRKLDQFFFSNLALDRQFFICSMYLSRISLFVISIRVIKEKVVVFKSPFSHKIEF